MEIPLYLAMTAAEFRRCVPLPSPIAWMACHFSPYGTGLSNLPEEFPPDSLIILSDYLPPSGHDPQRIAAQLAELHSRLRPMGILLDFQRPGSEETAVIAAQLTSALSCPVCVSDLYAKPLDCPVFLPPPELTCRLEAHLAPWVGREIWMEAACESVSWEITESGATCAPSDPLRSLPFCDKDLHCHYRLTMEESAAIFQMTRTRDDLASLLAEARQLGVACAVGLWQELN